MPYQQETTWKPEFLVSESEERERMVEELIRNPQQKASELKEAQEYLNTLETLAESLGSMQRDAFFYFNFFEQLKNGGPSVVAQVRQRMSDLGMFSATLPAEAGGPPNPAFDRLLNWLLTRMAEVGRRMGRVVFEVLPHFLGGLGIESTITISFSVGFPPSVIFGYETSLPVLIEDWVKKFLAKFYDELQKRAVLPVLNP
jgi:hypothetical protein